MMSVIHFKITWEWMVRGTSGARLVMGWMMDILFCLLLGMFKIAHRKQFKN